MPNRQNAFESKENALYADYVQGIKLSTGYKKYVTSDASIKPKIRMPRYAICVLRYSAA